MSYGAIAVCASGPSLCKEDIQLLKINKIPAITVNSSWQMHPECQYVFAGDEAWWNVNHYRINSSAQKWTCSKVASQLYGIHYFEKDNVEILSSGMVAILFAMSLGAENIILLGYDCSLQHSIHWHGLHAGMNNPTGHSIRRWKEESFLLAREIKRRVNVVNCSRESQLTCFPSVTLETTLQRVK